jgi:hypothetical protein
MGFGTARKSHIRDEQKEQFVPIVITKMERMKMLLVADYNIHP